MKRIKSIKEIRPRISIGIMGQDSGLGVTHLSIALANYIGGYLHARTAFVELGERDAMLGLSETGVEESFCKKGVDYYPAVSNGDLGYILNMDYEYTIIDLGVDSRKAREELMRCNGKLIVGSLSAWRKSEYYDYIDRLEKHTGDLDMYTFLALFGDKIEIKKCRRTFKIQVKGIPFIANPFCIDEKEIPFLQSLI